MKISYERGDKYKFDSFPGLAEGLVEKALEIGSVFYHINWTVTWNPNSDPSDIGVLDGNSGTQDILVRINSLIEKDTPDILQPEVYADEMVLITEAILTIRNMVTLPENALYMSEFSPLKDLLCITLCLPNRDSLVEVKHLALDIAEQLTPFMVLGSDEPLYKVLLDQMVSEDRGVILTALRALGRISMNLEATNTLSDVPGPVLQRICSWLLLNDDELTDACLDFLYQYTAVVPNVDHLIRSQTPEYLVDQLTRLLAHGARKVQREYVLMPEQKTPARDEIAPMPDDLLQDMLKLEEPDRVHRWVRSFFEEDNDSFVTQLAAWQAYQNAFVGPLKAIGQALITPADFIRNSTSVYKDSNAQVLREPGDPQQKFIIHGIRTRPRPLSMDGREYGRCLWATHASNKGDKCGQFFLTAKPMWEHILTVHLGAQRSEDGQYSNVEKEFTCTWGDCSRFPSPVKLYLHDFARHVNTHVSSILPATEGQARPVDRSWVIPAKTMAVTFEETMTVRDERNPNAPPQAAGIPLSAALVLRNIARNVVKTEAEDELVKAQEEGGESGGWNETLFRPILPRLFEILAENRALVCYFPSAQPLFFFFPRGGYYINVRPNTFLSEPVYCVAIGPHPNRQRWSRPLMCRVGSSSWGGKPLGSDPARAVLLKQSSTARMTPGPVLKTAGERQPKAKVKAIHAAAIHVQATGKALAKAKCRGKGESHSDRSPELQDKSWGAGGEGLASEMQNEGKKQSKYDQDVCARGGFKGKTVHLRTRGSGKRDEGIVRRAWRTMIVCMYSYFLFVCIGLRVIIPCPPAPEETRWLERCWTAGCQMKGGSSALRV